LLRGRKRTNSDPPPKKGRKRQAGGRFLPKRIAGLLFCADEKLLRVSAKEALDFKK